MKQRIKKIITHPLIFGSGIIFVASFIANLFNYAFNLILGRFFAVTDYGIYATLITFLGLFGIFPATFTTIFAKFAATYKARDDIKKIKTMFVYGFRIISIFATFLLLILTLSIFYISSFLHITDMKLLFLVFLTLFLSIVVSLPVGILQGEMRLYTLSFITILSPFLKIFIGFFLLFLGLKIFGVTIAIFISSLIAFAALLFLFRKSYGKHKLSKGELSQFYADFRKYSFQFFFSALGITILTSADMIIVKHFFIPEQAGQYAALSVMGRSIFYLTSPIYFVFFPLIAQKKERNENIHSTLFLAICIITLCSVALSFVYFIFPTIVLNIFFPQKEYSILTTYLGPFSLYVTIFSICMLFNSFLLSIGKANVYKINLFVATIFIFSMYLFHNSFYQIIGVLFGTSLLLLSFQLLYYVLTQNEKK